MKKSKRLLSIVLCFVLFVAAVPLTGIVNFAEIGNRIGDLISSVTEAITADDNYDVVLEGENYYLYDNDTKITETGMHTDGTDYYYVKTDGTLAHDEFLYTYNNDILEKAYYNFTSDCRMQKDGWLDIGDGRVFYFKDGQHSKGLTKIDNDYYFFYLNKAELCTDINIWVPRNDLGIRMGNYHFDKNGKIVDPVYGTDPEPDTTPTATGILLYNTFSDNMMFQRDQSLSVWGLADASSGMVVVEFAGETATAVVNSDRTWKATFDQTFSYTTEPMDLTVRGAEEEIVLKDILIGDVYYVIGQSNVHYDMQTQIVDLARNGGSMTYDFNDNRNIRFYRNSSMYTADLDGIFAQGTTTEFVDAMVDYDWMTPSDVEKNLSSYTNQNKLHRSFSALGYLLAYNLSEKTDIPIGIIEIDAAGMPLISFAPNSLADKWGDDIMDPVTGVYSYNLRKGYAQPTMISRFVYNQLIHPLKNFSTAGIIWYQGESDLLNHTGLWREDSKTFAYQFTELMTYFRNNFGDGSYDFPVYMIELPACFSNNKLNAYLTLGGIRSEQGIIGNMLDNFHLVSSADFFSNISWQNSLHPYIKHLQAERLANVVAADRYNVSDLATVQGPQYSSVSYGTNSVTVTFTNVGNGLRVYNNGALYGFEVCTGYDINGFPIWENANNAILNGSDKVTVTHTSAFYGVRYHAQDEAFYPGLPGFPPLSATLAGSNGIPATAFVDFK